MLHNFKASDEKIKLWTRQHKNLLIELEEKGVYRARQEYILLKNDTISNYYFKLYDWYVKQAERIVPRPEGVTYPIWLSTSSDAMLQPAEDTIILELEVERKHVVITNFDKWGYVVNYWYVPLDKQDEKRHNEELRKYGIGDESALYMSHKGNFYPLLRNKIIKSWERIFEVSDEASILTQATLWEIKKEWIVNIPYK
ncbi:protein of unknown function [Anaerovirgula multivorans]|uniref:DUF3841 domain-containing protein n=1 Tax=Anaerovirgula multivorans TaxID=312168 RepID=A0A239C1B8_9FIRM|nr:DUF3841 domain-containing protein [Anaerovirgula multivorans]SNS13163.1 protein of unknown function [Anaerovirgula multivorans]